MRTRFRACTAALLTASLLVACGNGTPRAPDPTSLVIVLVDTLSRDALAAGADLEGLAARGRARQALEDHPPDAALTEQLRSLGYVE